MSQKKFPVKKSVNVFENEEGELLVMRDILEYIVRVDALKDEATVKFVETSILIN